MRSPSLRLLFVCVLSCCLSACGDADKGSAPSPVAPDTGGSGIPAVLGGADTPEALVARVKAASSEQDIAEMFACVYPEHRAGMAYYMGVDPIHMMIGMAERLVRVAEKLAGRGDQAAEVKAEVSVMKEKHAALLAKYDLPVIDQDSESMQVKGQAALLLALHKEMGDLDHVGFVTDAMAILEAHASPGQKEAGGPFAEMEKDFKQPVAEINKQGDDTATVRFAKQDTAKVLLRRVDGRWYLTLAQPGN